jgi:hypothetical protein
LPPSWRTGPMPALPPPTARPRGQEGRGRRLPSVIASAACTLCAALKSSQIFGHKTARNSRDARPQTIRARFRSRQFGNHLFGSRRHAIGHHQRDFFCGSRLRVMARIVRPNFRRRPPPPPRYLKPRKRLSNYYDREVLVILVAFALLCAAFYFREHLDGAERTTAPSAAIDVVDGDTVRRDGRLYRLVGFNTPRPVGGRSAAKNARSRPKPRRALTN